VASSTETLQAKTREAQGTRACRKLRAEGQVPAVLYGHEEAPESVQVGRIELEDALRRRARMFELHLGAKKDMVLLKDVQYDAFGSDLVHADFIRVAMDEALRLEVPIQLKGQPKAEHAVLQQTLPQVEIECLPKDIPEALIALVGDLKIGDVFHVSQLTVPAGVKIITEGDLIVATLSAILEEIAAPTAAPVEGEGGVEPEVIGRKPGEEEGEEEEEGEKKK
jgi:large subunit ribosomal protein L25